MKFSQREPDQLIDEIFQSHKQNDLSELQPQITKGRHFSNTLKDQKHHSNYAIRNKIFSEISNKTTVEGNPSKNTVKTTKLDDIYVDEHLIKKVTQQKSENKKEPLKVILNRSQSSKKQNNVPIQSQKLVRESANKQTFLSMKEKEKSNPTNSKSNVDSLEKDTSNSLIKRQIREEIVEFQKAQKEQQMEMTKSDLITSLSVFDQCSHVMKSIKLNYKVQHVFNRHFSCAFSEPIRFSLPTKSTQYLQSEKISRYLNSEFKIYLNKKGQRSQLGTLKSNFVGSIYNFYPKDVDGIYFSILFKSQKLDNLQSFRYCEIYINKAVNSRSSHHHLVPSHKMESLEGLYLVNKDDEKNCDEGQIVKLHSQLPAWSQAHQSYYLKFSKKSIFPSAKNTILLDQNGRQVLQFYKNSHLTYNLTFQNPLSWIAAYGYALASTDFKLITQ